MATKIALACADERWRRGRLVGLVLRLLAALTLGSSLGFAQSPPPATPSPGGRSWLERTGAVEAALASQDPRASQDTSYGCALEELVLEMEAASSGMRRDDRDFGAAYCDATCTLIGVSPAQLCCEPDLNARVDRARSAAATWGNFPEARLRVENTYAMSLSRSSRLDEAEDVLLEAIRKFASARGNMAETLELLVNLSSLRCQFVKGEAFAGRCEELLEELIAAERASKALEWLRGHLLLRTQLSGDLAHIHLKMGQPERAAVDIEQEKRYALELGALEQPNIALIRLGMDRAEFSLSIQDFDGCLAACDEALNLGLELEPTERVLLTLSKAVALSQLARTGRADPIQASNLFDKVLRTPGLGELGRAAALDGIVDLDLRSGDLSSARSHLDELMVCIESKGGSIEPCHVEELRQQALAYRAQLSIRTQASREELHVRRTELEQACEDMFLRRSHAAITHGGVGYLHWANPRELLSARIDVELALEDSRAASERALDVLLRAQSLGTWGRTLGVPAPSLEEVRASLLPQHVGLLVYLPASDLTHLFVVDREGVRHHRLASRHVLVAATREFSRLISATPEEGEKDELARLADLRTVGGKLCDLLLPEEARAEIGNWRGFYVSGTDLIGNPCLESLPLPSGHDLGLEYAIAHLASVPVGVWLARRAHEHGEQPHRSSLLVFGGPPLSLSVRKHWPELRPFTLSEDDIRDLRSSFSFGEARFLAGADATRAKLNAAVLEPPDVLEVFTHGVYRLGGERPAGLVIGEDREAGEGILWCDDIEESPAMPRIVALFACGSALGPTRLGDDSAAQLGNAFLLRGSDVVLLSRGKLMYRAMIELARAFNAEAGIPGRSVAEALRAARTRLAQDPRWRDPFYLGQVSLLGIGWLQSDTDVVRPKVLEPAHESSSSSWVGWALGGTAAAIALVLALARQRGNPFRISRRDAS